MSPDGPTPTLDAPLVHYTVRSIPQYVEKLHRYAEWGAQDLAQRGRRAGLFEVALRPAWRFFRSYILQTGFLDGLHGLVVCALQSYGVFLKWSRLWELNCPGNTRPVTAGLRSVTCRRGGLALPRSWPIGGGMRGRSVDPSVASLPQLAPPASRVSTRS
jgi:hypothetical protein